MASITEIDAILPQTQCKECGYGGCLPYAEALYYSQASINQCPPGGLPVLEALGSLLNINPAPYRQDTFEKTRPPSIASIREKDCIGCTKCITACPVDAIIGSKQLMHAVISHECTGCGLCVAPCPVDCIELLPTKEASFVKELARERAKAKRIRGLREEHEKQEAYRKKRRLALPSEDKAMDIKAKQEYIQQAFARVKNKKS